MTAPLPQFVDTRDCRLYRFYVWDPRTNYTTKTLGYIGETVRQPLARLLEHLNDQPWSDTIVGWEVDDRVFAGKDAVLAAEAGAIRAEKPLYNIRGNMDNGRRIPPWTAKAQRLARDQAKGRQPWSPPQQRETVAASVGMRTPVRAEGRWLPSQWAPWQQKTALWVAGWAGPFAVFWGLLDRHGTPDRWDAGWAAVLATALLGYGLRLPYRRRRRRR